LFSAFVDTSSKYPFIQLLDKPTHDQADIYRSYYFSDFKKFTLIPPKSSLLCKVQFQLKEDFIKKLNYELQILIEIPFTNISTFSNYRLADQVLNINKEITINLVDPKYYYNVTTKKNTKMVKIDTVFKLQTGFLGRLKISPK
jgi:hypothetical protein